MKQITYILIFFNIFLTACEKQDINTSYGSLIEVPNEVSSIGEAIKIAKNFDTILIHPGEYFEWDLKIDKPIYITSLYKSDSESIEISETTINSDYQSRTFTIANITDSVKMNGFTIKNAHAQSKFPVETEFLAYDGGAFYCYNATVKLTNLIIKDNSASEPNSRGTGGGLFIDSSDVQLDNVKINHNFSIATGGGIFCQYSKLTIYNSSITENTTSYGGPPISIAYSEIDLKNILFQDNINTFDVNPDIIFYNCTGRIENVSVVNDSIYISDNSIDFINCKIPGYE